MTELAKLEADLRQQNLVTWLETEAIKLGTPNQRERWAEDLLPEDELLGIARSELFKIVPEHFPRWHTGEQRRELSGWMLRKHVELQSHEYRFEVAELAELGPDGWERLKEIRLAIEKINQHPWLARAGATATLTTFSHWISCKVPECDAEACRSGAKISIPWAGRIFVREYLL